jgi:hypothetical protein
MGCEITGDLNFERQFLLIFPGANQTAVCGLQTAAVLRCEVDGKDPENLALSLFPHAIRNDI